MLRGDCKFIIQIFLDFKSSTINNGKIFTLRISLLLPRDDGGHL